jgi:hypothetical protein
MYLFLVMLVLTSAAFCQVTSASPGAQQSTAAQPAPTPKPSTAGLDTLPPRPPGKSTVIGGAIQNIDPVRDQFTLKVFGGKPMKLLFDERTQVFRDGKRTPLRELRPDDHASVETVLDGTKVFALSVHVLSQLPEGERRGQVIDYNPGSHELTVSDIMGQGPLKLRVPEDATILHVGQAASSQGAGSSDLVKGTLVSVRFKSDGKGQGVASQISILAKPGSAFVFSGNITFIDLRTKVLVLADPSNDSSYKISFDPNRLPIIRDLHEGTQVTVTATFDGGSYVATDIKTK